MKNYKRILVVQDISCVGQCSITVALPILSACGHETCILPTAVLSTHTGGFGKPEVRHLSGDMDCICDHWLQQNITFDCILVGYLGSIQAVRSLADKLDALLGTDGICIVDPAMADHGKLYSGLDEAYAEAMMELCKRAHIVLPNITEAAMMSGMPFRETLDENYVRLLLDRIPAENVVMTGVGFSSDETGAGIRRGEEVSFYFHRKIPRSFHGTGDMFAACFTGCLLEDFAFDKAVEVAAGFTCRAIENTISAPAHWYGVKFETVLPWLIDVLSNK